MGRAHEKWHICKCLVFHAENLLKVYTQKNSGYTKSRRKIRQQKIPKIDSKFLHIELLSREAWTSKDTRFLTLSSKFNACFCPCFPAVLNCYLQSMISQPSQLSLPVEFTIRYLPASSTNAVSRYPKTQPVSKQIYPVWGRRYRLLTLRRRVFPQPSR